MRHPAELIWGGPPPPLPRRGGDSSAGTDWALTIALVQARPGEDAHIFAPDVATAARWVRRLNEAARGSPQYVATQRGSVVWVRYRPLPWGAR